MKKIALIFALIFLTGCSTLEQILQSYDFGDASLQVIRLKQEYCIETDTVQKEINLLTIHIFESEWQPECN